MAVEQNKVEDDMPKNQELELEAEPVQRAPAILPAKAEDVSIVRLMQVAVERLGGEGAEQTVAALERLVALKERMDDRQAEAEFADAMARFQGMCSEIPENKTAKVLTKSGSKYQYSYAGLDDIAKTVRPFLAECGLSYTWDSEIKDGLVRAICTVIHRNGRSRSSSFISPIDESAHMNITQKHGAALTYAKRYALLQVLGLSTGDIDTDGNDPTTITENQAADIEALLEETGSSRGRFLEYMGVTCIADIRTADYRNAITKLEEKRRRQTS